MAIFNKPTLLFLAGHAGTGKTTLGAAIVKNEQRANRSWAFLDKDTIGGLFTRVLMQMHTGDGDDRDSPTFSNQVRPLEYLALAQVVRENLSLGTSCIACAPFGLECQSRNTYDAYARTFSDIARVVLVWSHVPIEEAHRRIVARAHPMDRYKLSNWPAHALRRYEPHWVHKHPDAFWLDSTRPNEQNTALRWLSEKV